MDLLDVNVLLSAVNPHDLRHSAANPWLRRALGGPPESLGLPWHSLIGFIRLVTGRQVLRRPWTLEEAMDTVDAWLAAPAAVVVHPGRRHAQHLRRLLAAAGRGGELVADAHLASLCLEHGATMVTFDSDYRRFTGLRSHSPA
ncbi:MAG: TA system VapC family ribonuclease toxin [Candidatus Dormiibacterota bacterium]